MADSLYWCGRASVSSIKLINCISFVLLCIRLYLSFMWYSEMFLMMLPLCLGCNWICMIKRRRKIYLRWLVLGIAPPWFVWVLNLLVHNALSRHSISRKLLMLQRLYTSVPRDGKFKLGQSYDKVKRMLVRLKLYAKKINKTKKSESII